MIAIGRILLALCLVSTVAHAGPAERAELAPVAANPDDGGFYLGVYGGAGLAQSFADQDLRRAEAGNRRVIFRSQFTDVLGAAGGFKAGYSFPSIPVYHVISLQPAVEAEALYIDSAVNFANSAPRVRILSSSSLNSAAWFVNGILRLRTGTLFTPYLGAGVGGQYLATTTTNFSNPTGDINRSHRGVDDLDFAVQGIVGLDFAIADHWTVFTEYKFIAAINPELRYQQSVLSTYNYVIDAGAYEQHFVTAGVKYGF